MKRKGNHQISKEHNDADMFIHVDSPKWRMPKEISVEDFKKLINAKFDVNVIAYKFKDQDKFPQIPPNTHKLESKIELAVDDNFLYVWVNDRWKRLSLNEF